jgi:23S rRNA pseudouridine2605 synthase
MPAQESDDEGGNDRVAKVLARAGVASRREVERLIEAGRVAINGRVLTTPAVKVEPGDILTFDGEVVGGAEPTRVFRYHKPAGLMTTHTDPKGRPTVFEALPPGLPRLISVGRLDLSSEGLLLLTNDGGLTRALELPSTGWARIYRARAYGDASQEKLDRLKDGITVEGVKYGPIDAKLDKASGRNVWITVTLAEGKNREVRRVLEALGLKVNRLIRLAYGPFSLGPLAPGQVEEVGPRVIRELLAEYIDAANLPSGNAVQFKAPANAPSRRDPSVRQAPKARAVEKPDKPVYKAGWAKPKPKPVSHVMPKKVKARAVADFGPGARDAKPRPFKSNAPLENSDRISKTRLNAAPGAKGKPPKDLRPKHFKDRDAPPPPAKGPKAGGDSAVDAQARAFRLALEALEDDRPKGRGARPGNPGGKPGARPGGKPMGRSAGPRGREDKAEERPPAREFKTKAHWFKGPEGAKGPAKAGTGKSDPAPGRGGAFKPGGKPAGAKRPGPPKRPR